MSDASVSAPAAAATAAATSAHPAATWRGVLVVVLGLVGFLWASDLQGILFAKDTLGAGSWWRSGTVYAVMVVLALWRWDWIWAQLASLRFLAVAGAATLAITLASLPDAPPPSMGPALSSSALASQPRTEAAFADREFAYVVPQRPGRPRSDAERFGFTDHSGEAGMQGGAQGGSDFTYRLPKGWLELPASSMRAINLRPAGDAELECYLTQLPGGAGGLHDNINRWRGQMGLGPLDDAAVAALPRAQLLGRDAVRVAIDGSFTGMGGGKVDDARMLGVILTLPRVMLFVKMTGPRAKVAAEEAAFDAFVASIQMRGAAAAQPQVAPPAPTGGLSWKVPDGWQQSDKQSQFRVVTVAPAEAPGSECYITVLPGDGGGVAGNVNRWLQQIGNEPLSGEALAALPRLKVLGTDAVLVEATGHYSGMGDESRPDHTLLGVVCPLGDRVVFVKMIGPKELMVAQRPRFVQFCESLEVK